MKSRNLYFVTAMLGFVLGIVAAEIGYRLVVRHHRVHPSLHAKPLR